MRKGKIDDILMFFTIFCSISKICMAYSGTALREIFERFALKTTENIEFCAVFHDCLC